MRKRARASGEVRGAAMTTCESREPLHIRGSRTRAFRITVCCSTNELVCKLRDVWARRHRRAPEAPEALRSFPRGCRSRIWSSSPRGGARCALRAEGVLAPRKSKKQLFHFALYPLSYRAERRGPGRIRTCDLDLPKIVCVCFERRGAGHEDARSPQRALCSLPRRRRRTIDVKEPPSSRASHRGRSTSTLELHPGRHATPPSGVRLLHDFGAPRPT